METEYEDIDNLMNKQNNLLDEQQRKQNEVINQQTQMNVDELNKEKEKIQKEVSKTNQGLYTQYQKQANQYGAGMEQLTQQGLASSGYAETTKTALYNTYQKNVTETLNNARELYSDYNFKISQAKQQGNILQAQSAVDLYAQRAQLLMQNYELRQNREKYLYQKERDKTSDNQWLKTFEEQTRQNEIENEWRQKQFEYQKQRDSVSDSQWQQQFNTSKKKSSSGSSRGGSSSLTVSDSTTKTIPKSAEEIIDKMKVLQGPNLKNNIKDGFSGKAFLNIQELLNYYGYAVI